MTILDASLTVRCPTLFLSSGHSTPSIHFVSQVKNTTPVTNANDSADDESELHGPRHLPRVGRNRSWGRLPERPIEVGHARRVGRAAAAVSHSGGQRHGSVCRQWRRRVSRSVDRKPDRTCVAELADPPPCRSSRFHGRSSNGHGIDDAQPDAAGRDRPVPGRTRQHHLCRRRRIDLRQGGVARSRRLPPESGSVLVQRGQGSSELISSFTKTEMPLPLSLAFMGMKFAKQMHSAPVFERPFLLRKIYYARFGAYVLFGVSSLIAFSNSSEASKGSSRS